MYNVNAAVALLWRDLFEEIASRAGVALEMIAHPAPAPLAELWSRPDLVCVFMCGWPFRRTWRNCRIVAAPVPASGPCEGPWYCTDFVVAAASRFRTIEDTFGGRLAWTDEESHSGFNAPRRHLANLRGGRNLLFREAVGPLVTPRNALMSVIDGLTDVAPLDSYFHALLSRHEPELANQLRVVDRTACAPIPPLVASPGVPTEFVARLTRMFVAAGDDAGLRPLLDELCLAGFEAVADPDIYALAETWDAEARAAGYPRPA